MNKTNTITALVMAGLAILLSTYPLPAATSEVDYLEATVFFDFNSDEVSPLGRDAIDILSRDLEGKKITMIIFVGYTDAIGQQKYNFELGHRRARKVLELLVRKGFKSEQMVVSWGGLKYLHENETPEGRALNRRVQVKALFEVPRSAPAPILTPQEPERK